MRRYWTRRWTETDPRIEPLDIVIDETGRAHVRVDQLVRAPEGTILENRQAEHVYEFDGPFIARMRIVEIAQPGDDDEEDE